MKNKRLILSYFVDNRRTGLFIPGMFRRNTSSFIGPGVMHLMTADAVYGGVATLSDLTGLLELACHGTNKLYEKYSHYENL